MNYVKAITDFIIADADLGPLVGDRVEFMVVSTDENNEYVGPYIVFTEGSFQNLREGFVGKGGPDHFPIIFDVVVRREDFIVGREIRGLLVDKFNGFNGVLTADFLGHIQRDGHSELLYNHKTDQVSLQSRFTFKTRVDV